MSKYQAVQVSKAGGDFEVVERELLPPARNEVRIKVHACGVCHSDVITKLGLWPNLQYPRIPGHEVAGVIDAIGSDVTEWKVGDRVGVGWHGGHCGVCANCRRGDFIACVREDVTGVTRDGGYQQYLLAPHEAVASLPDGIDFIDAAPLLCAGITTFNALRHIGAQPGDLVAVQGIGGLGHLGIQYAAKFGFRTVAIGRGAENGALAKKLGAYAYIDSQTTDAAAELQKLGGAKVILATAPSSKAMSDLINGLSVSGKLLVVGATNDPIEVTPLQLILARRGLQGWPSGTAADSEDALRFSQFAGVKAMIETYPLAKAAEAFARMESGKAQFRVVLTM